MSQSLPQINDHFSGMPFEISSNGISNYFWPVDQKKFWNETRELTYVLAARIRELNSLNEELNQYLTLLSSQLLIELTSILYKDRIKKGYSALENETRHPANLPFTNPSNSPDYTGGNRALTILSRGVPSRGRIRRTQLRILKELAVRDGFRRRPLSMTNLDEHIVTVSRQPLIDLYRKTENRPINLLPLAEWFPSITPSDTAKAMSYDFDTDVFENLLQSLSSNLSDMDVSFDETVQHHFRNFAITASKWLRFFRVRVMETGTPIPKRLWIGSSGIIWNKLLATLVREVGGHVTGFDHSQGSNLTRNSIFPVTELQVVDRFITFSKAHIRNYRDALPKVMMSDRKPEISMPDISKSYEKISYEPTGIVSGKVTSVLYIAPFVPVSEFGPYCMLPAIPSFDWQARLLSALRRHGLTVGLKPHPETKVEHVDYFKNLDYVKILDGKSEDHMNNYDVVLFDWPFQTSFGEALKRIVPIVFVDLGVAKYTRDERDRLERRCAVVDAQFDDHNRVQLDEFDLQSAVMNAPGLRDPSVLEDFNATLVAN